MRKRIFILALFLVTVFGLVACNRGTDEPTDVEKLNDIMDSITLPSEVTGVFNLVTEQEDVTITWESSNVLAIMIFEDRAIVERSNVDVTVELTATFKLGEIEEKRKFEVVVKALSVEAINVTFKVTLPDNTPANEQIHIAGNFAQFTSLPDWDPTSGLATRNGNVAEITIPFNISSDFMLEYKWTRGSWDNVETLIDGSDLDNRATLITLDNPTVTITNEVEQWKDKPGGVVVEEPVDVTVTFIVEVPANTPMDEDIFIVGDLDLMGEGHPNWNEAGSDSTKLERVSATEARITFNFKTNRALTISYKYNRGSWASVEKNLENEEIGNRNFTVDLDNPSSSVNDKVLKWNDLELGEVGEEKTYTINFAVTIPDNTLGDVYVVGNFTNWEAEPIKLIKQENGTYTATAKFITNGKTLEYKYTNGLPWDFPEGNEDGNYLDNRKVTLDSVEIEISDEVLGWENGGWKEPVLPQNPFDVDVTFNVALPEETPAGDEIFIVGNFNLFGEYPEWDAGSEQLKMTRDGLNASITLKLSVTTNSNLEYKFTRGSFEKEEVKADGENLDNNRSLELTEDNLTVNLDLEVLRWKDVPPIVIEEPVDYNITFVLTVPDNTLGDVYVVGNFTNWEAEPIKLIKQENGTYTATATFVTNGTTLEYKYTNGLPWDFPEGNEEGNYLDNRKITLDSVELELTDEVLGWENGGWKEPVLPQNPFDVDITFNVVLPEETPEADEIFIVGNFNLFGEYPEWDAGSEQLKMTRDGLNATITLKLSVITNSELLYKFTRNSWENEERKLDGSDLGNRSLELTEDNLTVNLDLEVLRWKDVPPIVIEEPVDYNVTFVLTVPNYTGDEDIYIAGSFTSWGEEPVKLLKQDDGTYKVELTLELTSKTIEYKYSYGLPFDNAEGNEVGEYRGNREVTLESTTEIINDEVLSWEGIEKPVDPEETFDVDVTFNVALPKETPEADEIFIVGNFHLFGEYPNWDAGSEQLKMTRDGLNASITLKLTVTTNSKLEYKFTRGSFEKEEVKADGENLDSNRSLELTEDNLTVSLDLEVLRWKDVPPIVIEEPVEYTYSITVVVPAGTIGDVYIVGEFTDWQDNPIKLERQENGTYTATTTIETTKTTLEYKYTNELPWAFPEGNEEGGNRDNRVLTLTLDDMTINDTVLSWENGGLKESIVKQLEETIANAAEYKYDDFEYSVNHIFESNKITGKYFEDAIINGNIMNDLARFLGALKRVELSSVEEIIYKELTYTWDEEKGLLGSKWVNEDVTLISVIVSDFMSEEIKEENIVSLTLVSKEGVQLDLTFVLLIEESIESFNVDVTFNVLLPEGTPEDDDIFIVGNFHLFGAYPNWDAGSEALRLTRTDLIATITLSLTVTTESNLEFKFTRGSFDTVEINLDGTNIDNRSLEITDEELGISIDFTVLNWLEVVALEISVMLPVGTPEDEDIYITGNFNSFGAYDDWNAGSEALKLTRNNLTATITLKLIVTNTRTLEYKFTRNSWDNEEVNAEGKGLSNRILELKEDELEVSLELSILRWKNITPPELGEAVEYTLDILVTVPEGTKGDIYIVGDFTEWAENPVKLIKQEDGSFTGSITFSTNKTLLQYKFTNDLPWDFVEANENQSPRDNRGALVNLEGILINDEVLAWENGGWEEPIEVDEEIDVELTFVVTIPASTSMDDDIYVAGDFDKIGNYPVWDPAGIKLDRTSETEARITFNFKTKVQLSFSFKFTKGSWDNQDSFDQNRSYTIDLENPENIVNITINGWQ